MRHVKAMRHDQKRASVLSRASRELLRASQIARQELGISSLEEAMSNAMVAQYVARARSLSMNKENIERNVKKGLGILEGVTTEKVVLEVKGYSGALFLVIADSEKKTRFIGNVRAVLSKFEGVQLLPAGQALFAFQEKAIVVVKRSGEESLAQEFDEKIMELAIESGAEDVLPAEFDDHEKNTTWRIVGAKEMYGEIVAFIRNYVSQNPQLGIEVDHANSGVEFVPKEDMMADVDDSQTLETNLQLARLLENFNADGEIRGLPPPSDIEDSRVIHNIRLN